jgi:bacillithiol synthase
MPPAIQKLPFEKTNAFSSFFLDFVNKKTELEKFFSRYPSVASFQQQISDKEKNFSAANRQTLADALPLQYEGFTLNEAVTTNLRALAHEKTFTVTTGHQLNIFTGPLYFIYKIVTVINACKQLKQQYPAYHFVPVYWMASEDHDYDEIKYFKLYGKKYTWSTSQQGAVGRFHTNDFKSLLEEVPGNVALFKEAYLKHATLAGAVRYYVNELFGKEGLVVVDGDDRNLKTLFKHVIKDDLFAHTSHQLVGQTNTQLEALGYKPQIHSREINFFYLDHQLRSRIEKRGELFEVVDTNIKFTKQEIERLIESHPEKFSPNVILRPLYQEVILPNLSYCGGPAEIVYWLQLKQVFAQFNVLFPVLLPRSFGMVIDEPTQRKLQKASVALEDVFLAKNELFNQIVLTHSRDRVSLEGLRAAMENQFAEVKQKALVVDKTLEPMVAAETRRLQRSLEKIEGKLLKAEKRKYEDKLRQIEAVKDALFPGGSLQERTDNFLNFYQQDPTFVDTLLQAFDPFELKFNVLYL